MDRNDSWDFVTASSPTLPPELADFVVVGRTPKGATEVREGTVVGGAEVSEATPAVSPREAAVHSTPPPAFPPRPPSSAGVGPTATPVPLLRMPAAVAGSVESIFYDCNMRHFTPRGSMEEDAASPSAARAQSRGEVAERSPLTKGHRGFDAEEERPSVPVASVAASNLDPTPQYPTVQTVSVASGPSAVDLTRRDSIPPATRIDEAGSEFSAETAQKQACDHPRLPLAVLPRGASAPVMPTEGTLYPSISSNTSISSSSMSSVSASTVSKSVATARGHLPTTGDFPTDDTHEAQHPQLTTAAMSTLSGSSTEVESPVETKQWAATVEREREVGRRSISTARCVWQTLVVALAVDALVAIPVDPPTISRFSLTAAVLSTTALALRRCGLFRGRTELAQKNAANEGSGSAPLVDRGFEETPSGDVLTSATARPPQSTTSYVCSAIRRFIPAAVGYAVTTTVEAVGRQSASAYGSNRLRDVALLLMQLWQWELLSRCGGASQNWKLVIAAAIAADHLSFLCRAVWPWKGRGLQWLVQVVRVVTVLQIAEGATPAQAIVIMALTLGALTFGRKIAYP